ncbi:hypothetical protein L211DRAFT_589967 [Terfezia boudieri ATCC MYA-4762]|uniref:Uncharacterized protein n=1 Tax=Terfezia boudieri ATCC MYA-4762 TaxID=1051890 RepID=A0A3N4LA85_9PEZI|nr:hypothetical protein L211DRAFT_589967 [Terfezia boudieri ATCC MYA-4762]
MLIPPQLEIIRFGKRNTLGSARGMSGTERPSRYGTMKMGPITLAWIMQTYDAQSITIDLPVVIIRTITPPSPDPITVAGCLARFVLHEDDYENLCGQSIGHQLGAYVPMEQYKSRT